jgi:hypothetical protein
MRLNHLNETETARRVTWGLDKVTVRTNIVTRPLDRHVFLDFVILEA